MNNSYLLIGIFIAAFVTFLTRVIPFVLFSNKKPSPLFRLVEVNLPIMIMIVLVFYALKDIDFLVFPYGLPELIGIFVAIFLHVSFNHALLSILGSTAFYMFLVQNHFLF